MTGGEWWARNVPGDLPENQPADFPGSLPGPKTRLVGRRAELAEIQRLYQGDAGARLVTVTGVGGVGKTRLAQAAAAGLRPCFRDGAWWVELSPLQEGVLLPYAIGQALSVANEITRPMIEVVGDYLAGRELLLVLDTCEHLVEACASAARALLAAAPGLRILVTSRRPLGMADEQLVLIDPLPVPGSDDRAAAEADAVALLAERAAEAVPGFEITDTNRAEVLRLCRRLEGLPLALELAAARLRELSVRELTKKLDDRFAVLAVLGEPDEVAVDAQPSPSSLPRSSRDGPPWHRALRTAIGWSHELCAPAERLLWARLSVFAGSFDSGAASRVCAGVHLPYEEIPALLGSLAEKSILIWVPTAGGDRYRMLDTIREYGATWLRRLGEEDRLRHRHRSFYLALARRGDAAWIGADQYAWYDRANGEHTNFRAALEYTLAQQDGLTALELAGALWFFWYPCGHLKEGQHYLERALALGTAPSPARDKALWVCSMVLLCQGDAAAGTAWADQCVAEAERLDDMDAATTARACLLVAATMLGDRATVFSQSEHLLTLTSPGDGALVGPLPLARLLARVLAGIALSADGRPDEAIAMLEAMRTECRRCGEQWMRAYGDVMRAHAELACSRPEAALRYARAALKVKHRLHDSLGCALALDVLAVATGADGQSECAAWLLGLARHAWDTIGLPQAGIPEFVTARRSCEQQANESLGELGYKAAFHTGYATDLDTGIAYALDRPQLR
ncbi:ATP-binding protein [Streptomyces violens]|uniref:ATP-binding protein n=1 Tax=Streptomyces violens TaxID=66377 RepID=UPI0006916F4C|nr:AAA family ATPase [Streptomyces violens]